MKPFAKVTPDRLRLLGSEGDDLTGVVRIVPTREYPFKLLSASPMDPKKIAVALKEVAGENGPEYELTITNVMKKEGRYFGYVNIGTDSKVKPELKVYVSVYIRKKT